MLIGAAWIDCLMLYDTVLLRTFAAVCDAGSFTKAARVVNLTQSAVSLHVKRLEEQVGAQLLRREPQGVSPTEQGEVLLSYARRILALHKEAERRLGGDAGGLIRIGAPEYFDLQTLSSLLREFSAQYPALRLQVELGIGPDIAAMLEAGELDLAILSREIGEGGRHRAVAREAHLGRRSHHATRCGRSGALALYPANCRWRQVVLDRLDRAGRPWTVAVRSSGIAGILAALDAGLAITIFPESSLPEALKPIGNAAALPPLPDFEFVLRRSAVRGSAVDHLAQMIANFFQLSAALRPGKVANYDAWPQPMSRLAEPSACDSAGTLPRSGPSPSAIVRCAITASRSLG